MTDGKYAFHGNFNYFAYESGVIYTEYPDLKEDIQEDYELRCTSWEQSRSGFLEHGRLPWSADRPYDPESGVCGPLLRQLGGEPDLGNWDEEGIPVNRSGQPFCFIGEVQGFSYCDGGIDSLLLFYDPAEQVALFITDYT